MIQMIWILIVLQLSLGFLDVSFTNLRKDAIQKFHYDMEKCKTSNCIFKAQIWFYRENEKIKMKLRLFSLRKRFKRCNQKCQKEMEKIKFRFSSVLKRIKYMKCKRSFQKLILFKRKQIVKCLEEKSENCFLKLEKAKKRLSYKKNRCKYINNHET